MFGRKKKNTSNIDMSTPEGFEEVYKLHSKLLLNIAFNQLHDKTEAENIIQDVFCRLWERKDKLEIEGPVKNYLIRAIKLAVFSYIRKKVGREQLNSQIYREPEKQVSNLEDELDFNESMDKAKELVSLLPPQRQTIYRLRTEELMNNSDIANQLVISKKTVDSQLTKAVKFLRQNLKEV